DVGPGLRSATRFPYTTLFRSPQYKEIVYQTVMARSKGARLWDIDGNEYIDANNGFGMSLFGWQPDFVVDAVRDLLDRGYEIGPRSEEHTSELQSRENLVCRLL